MRPSRRQSDELRAVTLERAVVKYAEGSCFVKFGDTHVLVTATLEERLSSQVAITKNLKLLNSHFFHINHTVISLVICRTSSSVRNGTFSRMIRSNRWSHSLPPELPLSTVVTGRVISVMRSSTSTILRA